MRRDSSPFSILHSPFSFRQKKRERLSPFPFSTLTQIFSLHLHYAQCLQSVVVHEVNHVHAVAAIAEVDVECVVAFDGCAAGAADDTALQINDAQ